MDESEEYEVMSCVRGYHIYQLIWDASIGFDAKVIAITRMIDMHERRNYCWPFTSKTILDVQSFSEARW